MPRTLEERIDNLQAAVSRMPSTKALVRFMLIIWVLSIVAMWFATAAQAQMACGTRDSIVERLGEKYGEVWRGGGLSGPTTIFEIWASEATGTWTILKTTPNGMTCLVAIGDGWRDDTGGVRPETTAGDLI